MRILLTGDYRRDEFARALAEMSQADEVVSVDALPAAAEWLKGQAAIDLVVVAQARPGQFPLIQIEAIRNGAPLAPIVALLGSWCEGEMRSGSPWPGVTRVYWHQWVERLRQESEKWAGGQPGAWTRPPTATPEDRLLWSDTSRDGQCHQIVAVVSGHNETRDWLAAACDIWNMSTVTLGRPPTEQLEGIALVLWDAGPSIAGAIEAFARGISQFPGAQAVVLADFPRAEDVESFLAGGAATVLSKPLLLNDLLAVVTRVSNEKRAAAHPPSVGRSP
ncbi:MAG TPA: hypothetical protein VG125_14795 [Pirellulales bacterium]|nr:hypothetical protein [Pirellulales bacterium]